MLILFAFSCKTPTAVTKTAPAPPASAVTDESAIIIDSIRYRQLQFEYLTGRAKVHVVMENEETDFTANIRMKRDSAIWVSISPALGVEAVRLLMTVDSIRVIERLEKKRYARNYGYFRSYTSLPVDFFTMQQLILGQPLFLKDHYEVTAADTAISLTLNEAAVTDSLVVNRSYQMTFQQLHDSASSMETVNSQFDIQYNPPFSLWRKITLRQKGVMTIEINFSRIKLNEPVKFPFRSEE